VDFDVQIDSHQQLISETISIGLHDARNLQIQIQICVAVFKVLLLMYSQLYMFRAYAPETCRAENTSIKLPFCIKLAFHIISWYGIVHCRRSWVRKRKGDKVSCSCVVYLLTRRIWLCFRVMWRIRESSNSCFCLFLCRWPQTWLQFAARNNTAAVVCIVHVTHWLENVRVGHELPLSKWFARARAHAHTHTHTHKNIISDSFVVLNQMIKVNFYDNFFS